MIYRLGNRYIASYTKSEENSADPVVDKGTVTYGPYEQQTPFAAEKASVRYDYTAPVTKVTKLERSLWVSHFGGTLSAEENYWLTNAGAE